MTERNLIFVAACLREGFHPANVVRSLDDMKAAERNGGFLNTTLPNGKRLGECTCEEVGRIGAALERIASAWQDE